MSGVAAIASRSGILNVLPPIANLVISNVPGSPVPLYFAGARVVSFYPVSIIVHSMALNVTVQSYAGRLDYGLIACRRAVPDITDLGDYILAEHQKLLAAAQAHVTKAEAVVPAGVKAVAVAKVVVAGKSKAPSKLKLVTAKVAPRARKPAARKSARA
jgi:diacylglycerol O-acyltransferase / wax synthase